MTETRRVPTQERSKKRVEAIMDSAARVFAEVGFERATMEKIAATAGTSIGSIYQFYPDKLRLFEAIAHRCVEQTQAAFDFVASATSSDTPWQVLLDGAVDALALLRENDPGFQALVANFQLYGVFAESDATLSEHIARQLQTWLKGYFPSMSPNERKVVATMLVSVSAAMLVLSQREPPKRRAAMLSETKLMLRSYLSAHA